MYINTQEATERCLGRHIVARQQRGQRVLAWESKCCYDIDLKQSLEQLLNNEAIYEQVYKGYYIKLCARQ